MGPQAEFLETVLTCKGNYYAPDFSSRLDDLKCRLQKLVIPDNENNFEVKKVEPWNSVRVTLKLPADAAYKLKHLAEQRDGILREIGILAVQIEGDSAISLLADSTNNSVNTNVQNDNIISSSSITCPVKNVPSNDISKSFSNSIMFNHMPNPRISTLNQMSLTGTKLNECFYQQINNVHSKPQTNSSCPSFISTLDSDCKNVTLNSSNNNPVLPNKNSNFTLPVTSSQIILSSSSVCSTVPSSMQYTNTQMVDDNFMGCQNIASSSPLLVNLLKSPGGRTNFNTSSQLSTRSICEAMELSSLSTQKRKRNQMKRSKRLKESPDLNYLYPGLSTNCTKMSGSCLSSSLSSSSSSSLSITPHHNDLLGTWSQQVVNNGPFDHNSQNATNFSLEYQPKASNPHLEYSDKCKFTNNDKTVRANDPSNSKMEIGIANVNSHSSTHCHNRSYLTAFSSAPSSLGVDSLQTKHIVSSHSSQSVSQYQMSKYSNSPGVKINLNNYNSQKSLSNSLLASTSTTLSSVSHNYRSLDAPSFTQSTSSSTASSFSTQTYFQQFLNHISLDSQSKILSSSNLLHTNSNLLNYITNVHSDVLTASTSTTAAVPSTSSIATNLQTPQSYINASLFNVKPNMATMQHSLPTSIRNVNPILQDEQRLICADMLAENGRVQLQNSIRPLLSDHPSNLVTSSWTPGSSNPQVITDNKEDMSNLNAIPSSLPGKLVSTQAAQHAINSDVLYNQTLQILNSNPNYHQFLKELMPRLSTPLMNWSSSINNSPINGHQLHLTNPIIPSSNLKQCTMPANLLGSKNFIKMPEEQVVNRDNINYNNNNSLNINNNNVSINSSLENNPINDDRMKHIVSSSLLTQLSSVDVKFVLQNTNSSSSSSLTSVAISDAETNQHAQNSNSLSKYPPLKKPCKSTEDQLPQRSKANLTVAQLLEQVEIAKHSQMSSLPSPITQKSDISLDACAATVSTIPCTVSNTFADDSTEIKLQKPLQMTVVPLMPYSSKYYPSKTNYNSLTRASLDSLPMPITSPGYPHNLTESVQKAMRGLDFHNSPPSSPSTGNVKFIPSNVQQNTASSKAWPINMQTSIELPIDKMLPTECPSSFPNTLTDILSNQMKVSDVYESHSKEVATCEDIDIQDQLNDNIDNSRNFVGGVYPNEFDFVLNAEDENHLDSIIASKDYDDIERLAGTLASNIDDGDIDDAMIGYMIGEDDPESLEQQHLKDVSDFIKNDYLAINSVPTSDLNNAACLSNNEKSDSIGVANIKPQDPTISNNESEPLNEIKLNMEENGTDSNHVDSNDYEQSNPQAIPPVNKKIKRKSVASKKDNCSLQDASKSESSTDDVNNSNVTRMSTRSSNKAKCMPSSTVTSSTSCLTNSVEPLVVLTPTTNIDLKDMKNDGTTTSSTLTTNTAPTPRRSGRTIKKTEIALELTPTKSSEKPRRTSLREHYNNKELNSDQNSVVNRSSSNPAKIQIISLSIKQDSHGKLTKTKNPNTMRRHKSSNSNPVIREADESNDDMPIEKKDIIENDRTCLNDETLELSISSDESVPAKKQKVF